MMRTLTIAAAVVALSGAALLSTSPASAAAATAKNSGYIVEARLGGPGKHQQYRKLPRVQASGLARGGILVPYILKKAKAQREAINNWNSKVRNTYGAQYANWNRASAKSTSCSRVAAAVSCRVSAIPSGPRYGMLN